MKTTVEGSGGGASPAAGKRRRRKAAPRRRRNGGVSVRRRVQVDATTAPAPAPLQRLLAACRRAFGGPGTVPAPDDVALIRDILDKMVGEDVHLRAITKAAAASGPWTHPIITRTTIYKCKNFSIVIFLLPPGAVIPLHDHPGMTVFSKLLLGSLHVTSYDWVDADDRPPVAVGGGDRLVLRLAKRVVDADLSAPCDALVLFPESGGNMHRFAAATACAVLDVLGPPYSGDRDCTYYQDLPYYRHHHHDDDNADEAAVPAASATDDDEQKPCRLGWLLETRKPKELLMYEVPYTGPPILMWNKKRPAVDSAPATMSTDACMDV